MGKESIVKTYYYDYHSLKKSLDSSKILLDTYQLELDELLCYDRNNELRIKELKVKIASRNRIITYQESQLKLMANVIDTFPSQLKKTEDDVYKLQVMQGYSEAKIAQVLGYCPEHIRKICSKILDKFNNYLKTVD